MKLTKEDLISLIKDKGGNISVMSDSSGVGRHTLRKRINANPDLKLLQMSEKLLMGSERYVLSEKEKKKKEEEELTLNYRKTKKQIEDDDVKFKKNQIELRKKSESDLLNKSLEKHAPSWLDKDAIDKQVLIDALINHRGILTPIIIEFKTTRIYIEKMIRTDVDVAMACSEGFNRIKDEAINQLYRAAKSGHRWAVEKMIDKTCHDRGFIDKQVIDSTHKVVDETRQEINTRAYSLLTEVANPGRKSNPSPVGVA